MSWSGELHTGCCEAHAVECRDHSHQALPRRAVEVVVCIYHQPANTRTDVPLHKGAGKESGCCTCEVMIDELTAKESMVAASHM